ncbi:unnamed protein product [Durusdinium trenchii]|uniref:Uncharacterized protein n=2 Tax=Durusdinium trenchii TaxID=1381693 RepID=A0ABP0LXQ4_9DINO
MRARLVLVLLAHHLHRRICNNRQRQRSIHRLPAAVALLIQPYVLFHCVFLFLLGESCMQMWDLMQASSWLDAENFPRWPYSRRSNDPSERGLFVVFLRWMAIATPIVTLLTGMVTLVHLWCHHVNYERKFDKGLHWYPSHSHDLAMQVVAMPLIYGVFSLDCVIQTLLLMTGQASFGDKEQEHGLGLGRTPSSEFLKTLDLMRHLTEERCSTNLELADLCEAWALYNFGRLCLMRIRRQIRQEVPLLRSALARLDDVEKLLIFRDPEHFLFRPLEVTTGIGVKIFVYTCAVKSLFALTVTFVADSFHIKLCEKAPWLCHLQRSMDGAAFVTSTIAILSLIAIEHGFHQILELEGFAPLLKFLGVKVLVTVTFLQSLVISFVQQRDLLKSDEANLCNACLLCFEVFPLSLLTLYAWKPRRYEDWYDADGGWGREKEGEVVTVGRLAGEGTTFAATKKNSNNQNRRVLNKRTV